MPASYQNPHYYQSPPTPKTPSSKYGDLAAAYEAAVEEWHNISASHATLAQILANTESFAVLPADLYPPIPGVEGVNKTPFGPALLHRSYDISVIWTLVHLAQILLLRCHPAMPPAALMAAGICAQATQPYATLIGRIAASMPLPPGKDISPSLGAVITELTVPLFFAGIQFQDPHQRDWLDRAAAGSRQPHWLGICRHHCHRRRDVVGESSQLGRADRHTFVDAHERAEEDGPLIVDNLSPSGGVYWRDQEGDSGLGKNPKSLAKVLDMGEESMGGSDAARYPPGGQPGDGNFEAIPGSETAAQMSQGGQFVLQPPLPRFSAALLETEEDLPTGMRNVGL